MQHPTNVARRAQYLPIRPSPLYPDNGLSLEIEGQPLEKLSYIKVGQVRVCGLGALRAHGKRKLTAPLFNLLMIFAPAKPPNADAIALQRVRQLRPCTILIIYTHVSSQTNCPTLHNNHTNLAHTQNPRFPVNTMPERSLRESLFPRHQSSTTAHRTVFINGTFTA